MNVGLRRAIGWLLVIVVLAAVVFAVVQLTADPDDGVDEQVIVIDDVSRLTLQDTVVLRGQMAREPLFSVLAGGGGVITSLSIEEQSVVAVGDELLRVDGRPMVAVADPVPYWRPLSAGVEDGPDVEMLEQFLSDEGYEPGTINQDFSDATAEALERWQTDNDYPVDGVFRPTDVAVGQWPARVGAVDLPVGTTLIPGAELIPFVADELAVRVDVDPTDRSRLDVGLIARVEIPATGADGTGQISELAENAEIDQQGVERYRGEVELTSEFDVVDGTAVRVEVILEQVTNALAVPVAAVSLGDTGEEVRILNEDGTIDRVSVETGLTEGVMVEIVDGLDGSEQVVVEVRGE